MYAEATYLNARGKNEFLREERYLKPKPSFSWPPLALISSLPLVQCRPKINVYDTVLHDMYWGKSRIFQTDTVLLNKYLLRQMFIQMNCVKARCSRLTSLTFLLLKRATRIYLSNDHRVSLHLITFTRRVRMVLLYNFRIAPLNECAAVCLYRFRFICITILNSYQAVNVITEIAISADLPGFAPGEWTCRFVNSDHQNSDCSII